MAEDRELFATCSTGSASRTRRAGSWRARRKRRATRRLTSAHEDRPAGDHPARLHLGGTGGASSRPRRLLERTRTGLRLSPIHQVMIERCLVGWQEIEYEVMRDADDTCIAVCSMENVDPLGIHTATRSWSRGPDAPGSRPPAPPLCQPRDHPGAGSEGGCNVQFALSPDYADYAVIEVNPRVSRSPRSRRRRPAIPSRAWRPRSPRAGGWRRSRTS